MKQTQTPEGANEHGKGGILRVVKNDNYSKVNNTGLRDNRLSWGASGILAYLLTKPDDWQVKTVDLVNQKRPGRGSGRDGVQAMLRELEEIGYLTRERFQGDDGKWEWVTTVYETPQEKPQPAQPVTVQPAPVKPSIKEQLNYEGGEPQNSPPDRGNPGGASANAQTDARARPTAAKKVTEPPPWKHYESGRAIRADEYPDALKAQSRRHRGKVRVEKRTRAKGRAIPASDLFSDDSEIPDY